ADPRETTSGTIGFTSADGVSAVSLGGHVLTGTAQTFADTTGELTAWYEYNAATGVGTIHYSYTLLSNTSGDDTSVSFAVVVKDADGDPAPAGNLVISIVDDEPTAYADTDNVEAGSFAPITGDVLSNDVFGADGKDVSGGVVGVAKGSTGALDDATTVGATIQGTYGKLTLNADGSYSYLRDPGTAGGGQDVFTYTIKDADGDLSHTTLTIEIGNSTPTVSIPGAGSDGTKVYEAGLPAHDGKPAGSGETGDGSANADPRETTSGTIGFTSADGVSAVSLGGHVLTGTAQTFADATGELTAWYEYNATTGVGTIHYSYTLLTNTSGDDTSVSFAVVVKDADGDPAPAGNLVIDIVDDVPILNSVQSQQASNDPSQTPAVGHIDFVAGADGVGSAMTITANTTGITSGGHNLITVQTGNVLTAYADNDNNGTYNQGDTAVFTITVNPSSGQYVFDLLAPLDGKTTPVSIGSGSSFGSGPSSSVIVTQGGQNIVMVTGWKPTDANGVFTSQHESAWLGGGNPSLTQTNDVNGSGQGWGLGNNNFDKGEFMRFDFGTPNDYDGAGPYTPPNITLANASYATFTFDAVSSNNKIEFVAHFTDGTFRAYTPTNGITSLTITSPSGAQIAWIDAYESSGKTKLNLTNVGVTSTTVDHTIPVTLQLTDGDGDHTGTANFNVHVANGLTPYAEATSAMHNDIQALDVSHSIVAFDYTGDGQPTAAGIEALASPTVAEHIMGSDSSDLLVGGDGVNNILDGGPGNDILIGGDGNDLLIGGLGRDTLTGGAGADTFKLDSLDINDLITDYSGIGGDGDVIDLTSLFSTNGEDISHFVKYDQSTGVLSVDQDGAANGSNFVHVATLENMPLASTITLLYDDDKHTTAPSEG
ncbi:type I secretion C-terminal target domain-containing protein, partial [Mesorhizobium sp. KR2-14]|uniref:beta strand repeat-containing protein n=1 Tax=Mesorhizobium sp. KR2-14 TaxID=3156610 RepID=UPI0032B320B5